ncbi:hypothetical protein, partial [Dapis sp. BLCC M229]|uniref:hypothetical protein n=1 Tax=Dapis sp. BLCC M229 TaxID=3400188 RepID=UPI003CF4BA66
MWAIMNQIYGKPHLSSTTFILVHLATSYPPSGVSGYQSGQLYCLKDRLSGNGLAYCRVKLKMVYYSSKILGL